MSKMPLTVTEGRFYTRTTKDATLIVGAIKVPAGLVLETQTPFVIGPSPMLILDQSVDPYEDQVYPEMLLQSAADGLLTTLRFRSFLMPGIVDVLLRETHLPCSQTGMKWALIVGATKGVLDLPGPRGLYELKGDRMSYCNVAEELYNGSSINDVLRACHWGDEGLWGMATSMDPSTYDRWIVGERERNAKRDSQFRKFIKAMEREGLASVPTAYRQEHLDIREGASTRIMKKLIASNFADDAEASSSCAAPSSSSATPGHRPRP